MDASLSERESAPFHTPIEAILGGPGDPPECRAFSKDVAMHWFPAGAQPGDRCLCGDRTMEDSA